MMRDLLLLGWLRWRHMRGRADYWATLAGADLDSASVVERVYLFYLALLFGGWFVVMMAAASSGAVTLGASIEPSVRGALGPLVPLSPILLVGALSLRALRSSPVKLTFPDIAYVGTSALATRAVALSSCLREMLPATVAAAPVGYLAGWIAVGMGSPQTAPVATAVVCPVLVLTAFLLAWAAGLMRIRTDHRPWHPLAWVAAPLGVLAFALLPPSVSWPGVALVLALEGGAVEGHVFALLIVIGVLTWLLIVSAGKIDMIAVIEESALFAQLQVLRPMQRYDPTAYADIVRRKRLAARRPRGHLPSGSGTHALAARALVSHLRQPRSLVWPVVWGAAILPYVVSQVAHPPGIFAAFPAVFVFVIGPSRQLLHVFQQDIDRPSLREVLPFGNLRLLLVDSVPVIAILACVSVVAVGVQSASAQTRILSGLLCLLLGTIVVTCRGLERLTLPRMRVPIGYGISATISVCVVLYAGSVGSLALACVAASAMLFALCVMVRVTQE